MFPNWMLYLLELACYNDCGGNFDKFGLQRTLRNKRVCSLEFVSVAHFHTFFPKYL